MKLKLFSILLLTAFMTSCEPPQQSADSTPLEFRQNPDAQAAFDRVTDGGRRLPSEADLNAEINGEHSLTETVATPPCATCGVEEGEALVTGSAGNYTHSDRADLINQIIANGPDAFGTTQINIGNQCYEVMNDAPTLSDGTYVPFTFNEAERLIASRNWRGWDLPNESQALAIRRYAEQQGSVLDAITRRNGGYLHEEDSEINQSIADVMNDEGSRPGEMRRRAERGRRELINGHFKWYVRRGSSIGIYGFRKAGSSRYYQNSWSDAHASDRHYVDYSHSIRLMRPCQ